jgi:HSP20 family protein
MMFRDLIPWNRGRDVAVRRSQEANPFLMLHREMNRMLDDVSGLRPCPVQRQARVQR